MKTAELLKILKQSPYFTKQNLSLALEKEGEDLNYWINKLIREEMLMPLKKGFYISSYYRDLITQSQSVGYFEYLANVLRAPSYVSTEYVLANNNMIPEAVYAITSITTKSPRIYSTKIGSFIYRNIKKKLFFGYQIRDFADKKIKIATFTKALFDFLYLKKFSDQNELINYLLESGRFNWDTLTNNDKKEFKKIVKNSSSKKMSLIVSILEKEKI